MARLASIRLAQRRVVASTEIASGASVHGASGHDIAAALRARDLAERGARMREELLAMVAHDLANPLNSALLWAKVVLDAAPPGSEGETVRVAGRIISEAVVRMSMLVHDLSDIAYIETGCLRIQREQEDLDAIVSTAVDASSPMCVAKDLSIVGHAPALLRLSCDSRRLQQVLGNLVANAIKFTPRGGAITIDATPNAREVRFCVTDTGPGVSEETRARVFDRYWRGDDQRNATTGVGLGLFISKGIVDAHGGTIWVESAAGGGSAFCFTIPLG